MPRPTVTLMTYMRQASLWIALAFGVVFGWFFTQGVGDMRSGALLVRDGIETTGSVVDRGTEIVHTVRGQVNHYFLRLTFTDASGARHSTEKYVNLHGYNTARVGQSVSLRYATSNPAVVEFEYGARWHRGKIVAASGLGMGLVALGALVILLRNTASMRRAARNGSPRDVRIIAYHQYGKSLRKLFRMEWRDHPGISQRTGPVAKRNLVPIGGTITVYNDPDTDRSWWTGEF